jgi:hypothetical protein
MSLGQKLITARDTLTHLGPRWVAYRLKLACETRCGVLKRKLPARSWADINFGANGSPPASFLHLHKTRKEKFFFSAEQFRNWKAYFDSFDVGGRSPVSAAAQIGKGEFELFFHLRKDLGFPPRWNWNSVSNRTLPANVHFSSLSDFASGDIKVVWELSRFSFAFTLARAYARTGDDRFAETFWRLFEDWCDKNPPQMGPNWKCGQETALRVMAWIFAFHAFLSSPATTPPRAELFAKALFVSGERIFHHIDYALSQQNNHAISEAAGLFTLGLLYPEFPGAARWKEIGARYLESLAVELFYEDGGFAQHSLNYERLALHDYLWVMRLAELNGHAFSEKLRERISLAGDFLFKLQDEKSGRLPNYGHNDGALVLPLTNCDYSDFRPLMESLAALEGRNLPESAGPWDEEVLWLFGADKLERARTRPLRATLVASESGYFTLRGENSFGFIRCPECFRHRPGQADLLHFDLWHGGENIVCDPGTYSYNQPEPWNNALERTRFHNTVTFEGRDQMRKASRFLWLPWARGKVHLIKHAARYSYFEGEHLGYTPARHRRAVLRLPNDLWLVLDEAVAPFPQEMILHWLFTNPLCAWDYEQARLTCPTQFGLYFFQLGASAETSVTLVAADATSPRGWISRHYLARDPALSFQAHVKARRVLFASVFSPAPVRVIFSPKAFKIEAPALGYEIELARPEDPHLIRNILEHSASGSAKLAFPE